MLSCSNGFISTTGSLYNFLTSNFSIFIAMMPLWLFTLGRQIFTSANLVVPYRNIATFAVGLVIPLGLGLVAQKKLPRFAALMVRILKTFSALLLLFIIVFAIVTNLYLFELFSWQVIDIQFY